MRKNLGITFGRYGFGSTIGAIAICASTAIACGTSGPPDPGPTQSRAATTSTNGGNSPQAFTSQDVTFPAGPGAKAATGLPVASWSFHHDSNGSVLQGHAANGKILLHFIVQSQPDRSVRMRVLPSNEVTIVSATNEITYQPPPKGPSLAGAVQLAQVDFKAYTDTHTFAYDCTADLIVLAGATAALASCLGVETGVLAVVCAGAIATFVGASAMVAADCGPQTCVADYQCQDQYGPNYSCSGGACVCSAINPPECGADSCGIQHNCTYFFEACVNNVCVDESGGCNTTNACGVCNGPTGGCDGCGSSVDDCGVCGGNGSECSGGGGGGGGGGCSDYCSDPGPCCDSECCQGMYE